MATTSCPECGNDVGISHPFCPHCGASADNIRKAAAGLDALVTLGDVVHEHGTIEASNLDVDSLYKRFRKDRPDVNAITDKNGTPLHNAAFWAHEDIAKLLIDGGADVNAKGSSGETPLGIVIRQMDSLKFYKETGGDINDFPPLYKFKNILNLLRRYGGHE